MVDRPAVVDTSDVQFLDVRRSDFDRCASTLFKAESDLGFDVVWEPCAQQMSCGLLLILLKIAQAFSDMGGRVSFVQLLNQLITRRQDFASARTVYLIVDSRLPNLVDY